MSIPNFKNHTIWTGDNLPIMRGLNSESVDLLYLDPPFNSKGTKSQAEFLKERVKRGESIEWLQ